MNLDFLSSIRRKLGGIVARLTLILAVGCTPPRTLATAGLPGPAVASVPGPAPVSADTAAEPSIKAIIGKAVRCLHGKAEIYDCRDVDLLAYLPPTALGYVGSGECGAAIISDMWGWTDAKSGREFALVGRCDGTAFVEVTDPVHPKYLGDLPRSAGTQANSWRDIKVYHDYAFVVSDDPDNRHGIQVVDLRPLLTADPARPVTMVEVGHYDRVGSVHNLIIDTTSGFAYTTSGGRDCGSVMQIINIHDPVRPAFAGCTAIPHVHDAQCVIYHGPDAHYRGRELCLQANGEELGIDDVTDKLHPVTIATATYPNVGYTHQGWFTEDQRYFFLDDEMDEGHGRKTRTLVFDLSRLAEPVLAKEFFCTTEASDHNLYIRGPYVYEANYKAGLRVLDIHDPVQPKEIGYFDTTPGRPNTGGFWGAWTAYPYFRHGVVAISSFGVAGLFLVRFKPGARP